MLTRGSAEGTESHDLSRGGIVFDSKLYRLSLSLSVTYPGEDGGDDEEGRAPSDDKL